MDALTIVRRGPAGRPRGCQEGGAALSRRPTAPARPGEEALEGGILLSDETYIIYHPRPVHLTLRGMLRRSHRVFDPFDHHFIAHVWGPGGREDGGHLNLVRHFT